MLPSRGQIDCVEGRVQFRIAVLNHQKAMDRWERRRELVVEQLGELRPDMLALNEIDLPTESARGLWTRHHGSTRRTRTWRTCAWPSTPRRSIGWIRANVHVSRMAPTQAQSV